MLINKLKSLKNNQGFLKYFKNTSWLLSERILRMVVGLFVSIWVARYLGPDIFGLLSYTQSFVGLFSVIAGVGLDGIVVRELVKNPKKENVLLGTAFILKLFGAILTITVLYIAVHFTSNDKYTNILIFIIASATIFQALYVIDVYFQANVLSKYIAFTYSFSLLISNCIKILLIINKAPLIAFAWVVLLDSIVIALGYIYWYFRVKKEFFFSKIKFNFKIAKELLKDSWPLILSGMMIAIYAKIDQVMIKEILDNKSVGNYAAAVRLSVSWYFIAVIISSSLFPAIINAKKTNENLYYKRIQKLYDLMVWLAIFIAIPVTFLSDWVINLLYGIEYSEAGSVLKIHIWAAIFVFLLISSEKWYVAENYTKLVFYRNIIGAIVNIILNLILIPKMGIKGAALATLISYAIAGFLFDWFNKETRKIFYLKLNTLNLFRVIK